MNRWICRYILFLLGVALVSALAAPWVYWGVRTVADVKFHDVLNRCLLVSSLVGGFWILSRERLLSRQTLGLARSSHSRRDVALGVAIATGSVVVIWILGIATGALHWSLDHSAGRFIGVMLANVLAAVVVAVLEEVHFRGCLLGWLRQRTNVSLALGVVTLHYALAHFLDPTKAAKKSGVDWLSGFRVLGSYWEKHAFETSWLPKFALLVLIGAILGWCLLRTSRLYLSMGLHGGWVFAGKSLTFLTDDAGASIWWFGSGKLIGSPITILVLVMVFGLMIWICQKPTMRNDLAG